MTKILSLKKEYALYIAVLLFGLLMSAMAVKASSTISTNISTGGTLTVDTTSTLTGAVSMGATLSVTGATTLASTTVTGFKVSQVGTQLSRIVAGYCTTASTNIAASPASSGTTTPTFVSCTPSGGTSIISGTSDRVLVQATSSLPSHIVIQSASTTGGNLISVQLINTSTSTAVTGGIYSFNFFAFQ